MKLKTKKNKWVVYRQKEWNWANHKESPYTHIGPFVIEKRKRG